MPEPRFTAGANLKTPYRRCTGCSNPGRDSSRQRFSREGWKVLVVSVSVSVLCLFGFLFSVFFSGLILGLILGLTLGLILGLILGLGFWVSGLGWLCFLRFAFEVAGGFVMGFVYAGFTLEPPCAAGQFINNAISLSEVYRG